MTDHATRTSDYDTDYDWNDRLQDEGAYQRARGKAQEEWAEVRGDEMDEARGNWEQFKGYIKEKTGETGDTIERKFKEWF